MLTCVALLRHRPLTYHNRRIDLLNAALSLQNEVEKKNKRAKASSARRKKTKSKGGKSSVETDSAYHFIAFVPVGQKVYQLDGLKSAPVCIGKKPPPPPHP